MLHQPPGKISHVTSLQTSGPNGVGGLPCLPRQNAENEFGQLRLGGVGGGDDLRDVGRLEGVGEAHVGDDREADRLAGRSGRRRSPRARSTCRPRRPRSSAGSDIRPAFPGSGRLTATNTPWWATMFSRRAIGQGPVDQLVVVRLAHVGEPRAEAVVVDADQRVVAHQVDVVVDHHDVAAGGSSGFMPPQALETTSSFAPRAFITRTGSVICLQRIALVHVEAAFHRHDRQAAELAAHQPAAMAGRRAIGKVRNLARIRARPPPRSARRGCPGPCPG